MLKLEMNYLLKRKKKSSTPKGMKFFHFLAQ